MPQLKNLLISIFPAAVLLGCGTTVRESEKSTLAITLHNFDEQSRGATEGVNRNTTVTYFSSKRLFNACEKGDLNAAQLEIRKGANVNAIDSNARTPIYYAIRSKKFELVKYLVNSCGAKVDMADYRNITPLHIAAEVGSKSIVSFLVEKGAKINAKVASLDYSVTLKTAFSKAPIPDEAKNGKSPLHLAAESGSEDVVVLLLEKGADINYLTKEGVCPLDSASVSENNDIVALLRDRGGKTARQIIFKRKIVQSAFARVSNLLKEKPIHSSLFEDIKKRLYALDDLKHPIYFYISVNDFHNVRLILSNQSDQTKKPVGADGISPLLVASLIGNREIGEILISNGADLSEIFHEDYTVLHIATLLEDKDYCELLISNGANINTKTKTGKTALDFATQNGNAEINKLLRRNAGKTAEQLKAANK